MKQPTRAGAVLTTSLGGSWAWVFIELLSWVLTSPIPKIPAPPKVHPYSPNINYYVRQVFVFEFN
eukprot:2655661-Amphidinium_carterae.1